MFNWISKLFKSAPRCAQQLTPATKVLPVQKCIACNDTGKVFGEIGGCLCVCDCPECGPEIGVYPDGYWMRGGRPASTRPCSGEAKGGAE